MLVSLSELWLPVSQPPNHEGKLLKLNHSVPIWLFCFTQAGIIETIMRLVGRHHCPSCWHRLKYQGSHLLVLSIAFSSPPQVYAFSHFLQHRYPHSVSADSLRPSESVWVKLLQAHSALGNMGKSAFLRLLCYHDADNTWRLLPLRFQAGSARFLYPCALQIFKGLCSCPPHL